MKKPESEFSRTVSVARLPNHGLEERLQAKPAERAALARRFDLRDMPKLEAVLTVTPKKQGVVSIEGTVVADIIQDCVVTLEPVKTHFEIPVDMLLFPEENSGEDAPKPSEELEDEYDTFAGGIIDLGELAAQMVGVDIDPYPRKKGKELKNAEFGPKIETPRPFAELAAAVRKKKLKAKSKD